MSRVTRRAEALISLAAIEANCRTLKGQLSGGAELCAVVKADAYGHGAERTARAALAGGATWLGVAAAGEAEPLRASFPEARIFVMGALTHEELEQALRADADVAVWRESFRGLASRIAGELGVTARCHVKHDSGMGRLGEKDPETVSALADAVAADGNLELTGVWTHLATADERDDTFMAEQLQRFRGVATNVREQHAGILVHAANSAATLREPAAHFDLVRCGIAVYGMDPFGVDPAEQGLQPALELRSYVADVKRFAPGDSAGYGRRWQADADTWVGVIPVGYADGVRRSLTNNAEVLIRGRRHPLVGTVSMDNITVDLGTETDVGQGDEAVLIGARAGESVLAEEWAERLGTINYEITCGIGGRVPRVEG